MTGYRLLLPPGWVRVPVSEDGLRVVDLLLDQAFEGTPSDSTGPLRREMRSMLVAQLEAAAASRGVDLYLPAGGWRSRPTAASFLVSHLPPEALPLPESSDSPEEQAVAVLGALHGDGPGGAGAPVTVAGQAGLRFSRTEEAVVEQQEVSSLAVDYVLPVPHDEGWLVVAWNAVRHPSAPGVAEALTELFDAVLSTLRWVEEP